MNVCSAADGLTIKSDGKKFFLFVDGNEVESAADYNAIAKLATDIYVSKKASKDNMVGRKMFAPSAVGDSGSVVIVCKVPNGYVVQRCGSSQRFEVTPELLSEVPVQYFS